MRIPEQSDHRIRSKVITDSGGNVITFRSAPEPDPVFGASPRANVFEIVIGQGVVLPERSLIGGQVEKSGTLTVGQENAVRHITFVSMSMDCVFLFLLWNKK